MTDSIEPHLCGECKGGFVSRSKLFKHLRRMNHYDRSNSRGSDGSQGRSEKDQEGRDPCGDPKPKPISELGKDTMSTNETTWKCIGTGVYARTFPDANRLITTTRKGPCMDDVHTRTVIDAQSGAIFDECIVDNTPDDVLHRKMSRARDIRVELTMKKAQTMFESAGSDIAEVYSPPRI